MKVNLLNSPDHSNLPQARSSKPPQELSLLIEERTTDEAEAKRFFFYSPVNVRFDFFAIE